MDRNESVERVSTSKAREVFADLVNRVAYGGERIVIHRHGKDIAAIIPIDQLEQIDSGPGKSSR